MSFTAGQTLKFPPEGFRCAGTRRCSIRCVPRPIHIAAFNSLQDRRPRRARLAALRRARRHRHGPHAPRRTANAVEPLLLSPLVLPSLVYGLAALIVASLVGIRPSLWLTVTGHIVVFGPLMYRAPPSSRSGSNPSLEEASTTSARLPLDHPAAGDTAALLPGILAGAFLVFIQSLDNVSVSLFLADPRTTVLPLRMFALIEESLDVRVAAMSGILIAVALAHRRRTAATLHPAGLRAERRSRE